MESAEKYGWKKREREKKELLMTHTKEVKYSFVGSFDTTAKVIHPKYR